MKIEVTMRRIAVGWLALWLAGVAWAGDDPLLDTMEAELARSMEQLAGQDEPPYFMAYEIVDSRAVEMHGEDGAFGSHSDNRFRQFDVDLRVGDPELDNTHPSGEIDDLFSGLRRAEIFVPVDDDPLAIRVALWKETERRYRNAVSRLIQVRASKLVRVDEDDLGDFSAAEPQVWIGDLATLEVDRPLWEQRLREASQPFRNSAVVYDGSVRFSARAENRYYVNSEGARLRVPFAHYRVSIEVATLAPEGTKLKLYHSWDSATAAGLPGVDELVAKAQEMEQMLVALAQAPEAEPWSGPAILSGRSAAVFFHEIFGHRMEGHRLRDDEEGQTFGDEVGAAVLPPFLDVFDDPNLTTAVGVDLNGHYRYDNEGVAAERVVLVEDGVLERFLTGRTPIPRQDSSNGHGRRQSGHDVISRQGNLIVESSQSVPREQLRARLLEEVEAQGAPYGLLMDDITGGFTFTGRGLANVFNVSPVIVYRVYPDGRPDELVRGVDLIGTPLATFSQIIAAGDRVEVFNGYCGAESGWVPVSAVSPDLLVRRIEIQRKETGDELAPLLPPPDVDGGEDVADGGSR